MGETRVDLFHLLEDLRDAYLGPIEETILTEITANALDSGASSIAFSIDAHQASLTIVDNGSGMLRPELARYHDIAASTKRKGQGIGFAGVGIKLGLLACRDVVTETRRGSTHVATTWGLVSKHRAPWKWTPPAGLVTTRGTAVQLRLANVLSPLLDPTYVELTLRRQFATLFDGRFDRLLAEHGRRHVVCSINGQPIDRETEGDGLVVPVEIRLARKRKPSAVGYLVRRAAAVPHDEQGIAVSTLGKVITRGWDWLGLTPAVWRSGKRARRDSGACRCPHAQQDRLRALGRGWRALSRVPQGASGSGDAPARRVGRPRVRRPRIDHRRRSAFASSKPCWSRSPMSFRCSPPWSNSAGAARNGCPSPQRRCRPVPCRRWAPCPPMPARARRRQPTPHSTPHPRRLAVATPRSRPRMPPLDAPVRNDMPLPGAGGRRRPVRFGLHLSFDRREDDQDVARLVESTVSVNTSHPSYMRAGHARNWLPRRGSRGDGARTRGRGGGRPPCVPHELPREVGRGTRQQSATPTSSPRKSARAARLRSPMIRASYDEVSPKPDT